MLTLEHVAKWIEPWKRKVNGMLVKAVVELISDGTELQLVKVNLGSQVQSGVDRIGEYGLTSRPSEGAQAVVLFIEGRRDNPVVVGIDDGRYRVKLDADGEVALYSRFGNKIVMKADGGIEATPAAGQKFIINGNLDVIGTVDASVDVKAGPANVGLITHVHPGVTSGGASTGMGVG